MWSATTWTLKNLPVGLFPPYKPPSGTPSHITKFSVQISIFSSPTLSAPLSIDQMADSAVAEITVNPAKKGKNGRKALKQKNTNLPHSNEPNVSVQKPLQAVDLDAPTKENRKQESISSQPKKGKSKGKSEQQKSSPSSFEKELQEMQEMMETLRIEKERTEEMLKERDEMLKQKDEELDSKGREQEKLQNELKKLQRLKEFKPTVVSSFHILNESHFPWKKICGPYFSFEDLKWICEICFSRSL